jgi:hypothetical protein
MWVMVKIYVFRKDESSSKLVGLQRHSLKLVPMAGTHNPYDEFHHKIYVASGHDFLTIFVK